MVIYSRQSEGQLPYGPEPDGDVFRSSGRTASGWAGDSLIILPGGRPARRRRRGTAVGPPARPQPPTDRPPAEGGPMDPPGTVTNYANRLGDASPRVRNEAAQAIWERYSSELFALVRRHLSDRVRRRGDEGDILHSMYLRCSRGHGQGRVPGHRR